MTTTKSKAFGDFRKLLTPEAVLRHALEYFETTAAQCTDPDGYCDNRGPNGECCVFGSAIPDDIISRVPEDVSQPDYALSMVYLYPGFEEKHPEVSDAWEALQTLHDSWTRWSDSGGLNPFGVEALREAWENHVPNAPFPGYNYRGTP